MDRYHRQILLPFIGSDGQQKISKSRVLLIGCGALGGVIAEQLVRGGVGHLTVVDRDVVEWTNLQRQVLFDEGDARDGVPKAVAASRRLTAINSAVSIEPLVMDVHAGNVAVLLDVGVDLMLDGTDNVETRYLVNDLSVKQGVPWIYGACVGTDGRVMTVRPGVTPCLRCVFANPPAAGELPTCDTAGVLGPAAGVVASLQAIAALKILSGHPSATRTDGLLSLDLWNSRWRSVDTDDRRPDCRCCAQRDFEFLDRPVESSLATLCGRNAVQVRPAAGARIDLGTLAGKLASVGRLEQSAFLLRCHLAEETGIVLTVFPDAHTIVAGTTDVARARTLVSRYLGT